MTTAHKPTWNSAIGSDEQGGSLRGPQSRMTSSKDLPAQTKLHYRKQGQNAPSELQSRNWREELEEKERQVREKRKPAETIEDESTKRRRLDAPSREKEKEIERSEFNPLDRDDPDSSVESSDDSDDNSEDSEEAELMREFAKISKERELERQKLQEEQRTAEMHSKAEGILRGNPLLNTEKSDYNITKRWNDDVVFKHQTRTEPVKKQRFINDTTRNDFHRKFLNKYIK